jgi:hypothetical protein
MMVSKSMGLPIGGGDCGVAATGPSIAVGGVSRRFRATVGEGFLRGLTTFRWCPRMIRRVFLALGFGIGSLLYLAIRTGGWVRVGDFDG